jgi:RecA/RadA recombinase
MAKTKKPVRKKKSADDAPAKSNKKGLARFAEAEAFGDDGIAWLTNLKAEKEASWVKLPTWHIQLDIALRGGWSKGQTSGVSGPEGVGKTHELLELAATAYHFCRKCFTPIIEWMDYETGETATNCRCGKNLKMRTIYINGERRIDPAYVEKAFHIPEDDDEHFLIGYPKSGDFVADVVERAAAKKAVDLLLVDSFSSLLPEEQMGRRASHLKVAAHASMIQNLLWTLLEQNHRQAADRTGDITLVGSNQLRANIGGYGGDIETSGRAYQHMLVTNIRMFKPEANAGIKDKELTDKAERTVDFRFEVKKNSIGGGKGYTGSYRVYTQSWKGNPAGSSDEPEQLQELLSSLGLWTKEKNGYNVMGINFPLERDALKAFRGRGMQWMARFPIYFATFDPVVKTYLDPKNYFYSPFYDAEVTYEEIDGETYAKVSLKRRERTERPKTKGGKAAVVEAKPEEADVDVDEDVDVEITRDEGEEVVEGAAGEG